MPAQGMTARERWIDGAKRYGFVYVVLLICMLVVERRLPTDEQWTAYAIGAALGITVIESVAWLVRRLRRPRLVRPQ